jgi:hypothetical protein
MGRAAALIMLTITQNARHLPEHEKGGDKWVQPHTVRGRLYPPIPTSNVFLKTVQLLFLRIGASVGHGNPEIAEVGTTIRHSRAPQRFYGPDFIKSQP